MNSDSVGIVTPQCAEFDQPLTLACGRVLARYQLMYETYGELNAEASNAVLICHALSGHHHAAGYHSTEDRKPGWWEACIGPGKPIDTNRFFVVSLNNLGGCHGSTGPASIIRTPASPGARTSPRCGFATGCTARRAWPTASAFMPGPRSSEAAWGGCRPCAGHWNIRIASTTAWSSPLPCV